MNFSCRVENDARRCVRKIGGAIRSNEMDFFFEEKIDRFDRWKRIIIVCVCVQINSFPFFFLNSKFYYINQIKDYPIVLIE